MGSRADFLSGFSVRFRSKKAAHRRRAAHCGALCDCTHACPRSTGRCVDDEAASRASQSMTVQQAAQRMAPIDATRRRVARLTQVVLPQFIGKKERHDQQRQHEKCAQNHSLDHDEPPVPENVKSILCA